jgi:hypothetical protein
MTVAPTHRWFRWSLVTMFVVVTLFAVWLGYSANWIRQRRAFVSEQRQHLRAIGSDVDFYSSRNRVQAPYGAWLLGESGVARMFVLHEKGQRERDIRRARRLFPEATLATVVERPDATHLDRENLVPASAAPTL